jgi:hypothetical protein
MRSWDSIARRYVEHFTGEHDTTAQETFGALRAAPPDPALRPWDHLDALVKIANDNTRPAAEATKRKGDWMQTFLGGQFWPLDPRADEIHIGDIAHALSMQCRYAGHCLRFYSVAEHSVLLANWIWRGGATQQTALWALLHDASEAYLVDVPRPVKPHLTGYKAAEAKVMAAVCERFGLPEEMPAEVHEADGDIIADERANMAPCVAPWYATGKGLGVELQFWTPDEAEAAFLKTFAELRRGWGD